jgi:hypothetical protein
LIILMLPFFQVCTNHIMHLWTKLYKETNIDCTFPYAPEVLIGVKLICSFTVLTLCNVFFIQACFSAHNCIMLLDLWWCYVWINPLCVENIIKNVFNIPNLPNLRLYVWLKR